MNSVNDWAWGAAFLLLGFGLAFGLESGIEASSGWTQWLLIIFCVILVVNVLVVGMMWYCTSATAKRKRDQRDKERRRNS